MHSLAASIPILKRLGSPILKRLGSTHDATADINECATINGGCAAGAICVNTPGSRTCSCLPGLVGDGFNCAGGRVWQHGRWAHWRWRGRWGRRGARGPVPALHESAAQVVTAACTPLYKDLPPPYWRHAAASAGINLCAVNNGGCSADATCTPTANNQRACDCKPGFSGNGTTCAPLTGAHMRPSPACLDSAATVLLV